MKKFLVVLISIFCFACCVNAAEDFDTPIPAYDDEVRTSGPDTKFSQATLLRVEAFQKAETMLSVTIPEDKKICKIYQLSKNQNYIQKIKIPNAKIIEYTNGSYDIKFKDLPYMIFKYENDGSLAGVVQIMNKAKTPFYSFHYDANGQIKEIEINMSKYRSYVYNLNGLLARYILDDKTYSPNGKIILKRKNYFF